MFGMENEDGSDGLFENRMKFWRDLGLYTSKRYHSYEEPLKPPNSAIKITFVTWTGFICCSICVVFSYLHCK